MRVLVASSIALVSFAFTACSSPDSTVIIRRGPGQLPPGDASPCDGGACDAPPDASVDATVDALDASLDSDTDARCATDSDGACLLDPFDAGPDACNAALDCELRPTCIGGFLYPTSCGPANCGRAIRPCDSTDGTPCNPAQVCGLALTCVDGKLYPSTCGPTNCDQSIGTCDGGTTSARPSIPRVGGH